MLVPGRMFPKNDKRAEPPYESMDSPTTSGFRFVPDWKKPPLASIMAMSEMAKPSPPKTPQKIIDILDDAVAKMCEDEHFIKFGKTWGVMPNYGDTEKFRKVLDQDYETFKHVYEDIVKKKKK